MFSPFLGIRDIEVDPISSFFPKGGHSVTNSNEKFRSFKSKENIHKKEVGPYHGFGY